MGDGGKEGRREGGSCPKDEGAGGISTISRREAPNKRALYSFPECPRA